MGLPKNLPHLLKIAMDTVPSFHSLSVFLLLYTSFCPQDTIPSTKSLACNQVASSNTPSATTLCAAVLKYHLLMPALLVSKMAFPTWMGSVDSLYQIWPWKVWILWKVLFSYGIVPQSTLSHRDSVSLSFEIFVVFWPSIFAEKLIKEWQFKL